jgi:hypothetical protein
MLDSKSVSSVSCVRRYNTLEKYVIPLYSTLLFVLYDWVLGSADRPILPLNRMVTNEKPLWCRLWWKDEISKLQHIYKALQTIKYTAQCLLAYKKNKYFTYCSGNRNWWENRDITYNGFWENYTARSEVAAKKLSEKNFFHCISLNSLSWLSLKCNNFLLVYIYQQSMTKLSFEGKSWSNRNTLLELWPK